MPRAPRDAPPTGPLQGSVALGPPDWLVPPSDFSWPVAVLADLDGDGALDVLVRGVDAGGLGWYRNDGRGTFDDRRVIADTLGTLSGAQAVDIDGDGDLDVAAVSKSRMLAVWFENAGGTFGPPRGISGPARPDVDGEVWGLDFIRLADLDGDGDADVLLGGASRLYWAANVDGNGHFGLPRPVARNVIGFDVRPFDTDRDGDLDLVYSISGDQLVVSNNLNGRGTFGSPVRIETIGFLTDTAVGDLDGDGVPDLIVANDGGAAYAVFAGDSLRTERVNEVPDSWSVATADLDGDGRTDVVASARHGVLWKPALPPGPARPVLWVPPAPSEQASALGRFFVDAGDLDGDADADIVVSQQTGDRVLWAANDGAGGFGAPIEITRPVDLPSPRPPLAADLDGDGDLDLVLSSWTEGHVAWIETGGAGGLHTTWTGPGTVDLAAADDVDGDGDPDLVGQQGGRIVWLENDGRGAFSPPRPVGPRSTEPWQALAVFDADSDQRADVVSGGLRYGQMDRLAFDGDSLIVRCPVARDGARSVGSADFDGDGAPDLVVHHRSGAVVWYRNADGGGGFTPADTVASGTDAGYSGAVRALDADGDGDLDLLVRFSVEVERGTDSELSLFENLDGHGRFGARQRMPETVGLQRETVADVDRDDWPDLVGVAPVAGVFAPSRLVWLRNAGGRFEPARTLSGPALTLNVGLVVRDLDGDGVLDVVATSAEPNAVWRAAVVRGE